MKVIVDTNIIFSALLKEDNIFNEILFLSNDIEFYTVRYAMVEIFKHKEKIIKFSKCSEELVLELLHRVLKQIQFIDEDVLSIKSLKKGYELCKNIDEKDTLFVAMTIELNGFLWTSDKKLVKGLKEQAFDKFFIP